VGEIEAALERYERAPVYPSYAALAEKRRAEERDRCEWTEAVRRRLGLVAEVHRCHVERSACGPQWAWSCARSGCGEFRVYRPTQAAAFAEALAHARSFVPQPPEPEPWTGLDVLAFEAAWDAVRDEQARFAHLRDGFWDDSGILGAGD
jgi:hypothetical protein